jgi:hypothetical protein
MTAALWFAAGALVALGLVLLIGGVILALVLLEEPVDADRWRDRLAEPVRVPPPPAAAWRGRIRVVR